MKPKAKAGKAPPLPRSFNPLRGLHSAAGLLFTASGYRWEVHHARPSKIGVWRKRHGMGSTRRRLFGVKNKAPRVFTVVPGFGDTPISWIPVLKMLEPLLWLYFDEIAVLDFPGFNGFLYRERPYANMDDFLRAGGAVLKKLKPHTILGHSLGGWLTAHFAATAAKKPTRVILVAPTGAFDSADSRKRWADLFDNVRTTKDFSAVRSHMFAKEPPWFRLLGSEFERFVKNEDCINFMYSVEERHLVETHLRHMTSDLWFLWGEKDTLIPPKTLKGWKRHLPKALTPERQTVLFKGVGHSPQLECSAKLAFTVARIVAG